MKTTYWNKQYLIKKLEMIEFMGGCCKNCGYRKYHGALELHHLNPSEKEYQWDRLRKQPWEKMKIELAKCTLLCSNCHREVHEKSGHAELVKVWKQSIRDNKVPAKICPTCNRQFKPRMNKIIHCSLLCSSKQREKIKWPDNLLELSENHSNLALSKILGVSDKAVAKRLKKFRV